MKLIVSADGGWGIGRGNKLLYSIPEDMAFFKETTGGKVVVMGKRTLLSFPNSAPLKNRVNIVLTRDESLQISGALMCNSIDSLAGILEQYDSDSVYVIGGQSVYSLLLCHCDEALVTKIDRKRPADSFFPNIDGEKQWVLKAQSEKKTHNGINYRFCRYLNTEVRPLL